MSGSGIVSYLGLAVLWIVAIATISTSHARLVSLMPDNDKLAEHDWLPDPDVIKTLSLGHDRVLADLFWLSTVQYLGDPRRIIEGNYRLAYRSFDLITKLDPRFEKPYWFAAFTLGYSCKNPQAADKMLARGTAAMPNEWFMWFIRGVNMYLFAHADRKAAAFYKKAGSLPDAPSYVSRHAELLERGVTGLERDARGWLLMYVSARNPSEKAAARDHLIDAYLRIYVQTPLPSMKQYIKTNLSQLGVDAETASKHLRRQVQQ